MTPAARIRPVDHDRILVEVAGHRILVPAACPHRKGRLRFGRVNPRTLRITCPLHHATFDLLSGQRVGGPTCGPLRVTVLDGVASTSVSAGAAEQPFPPPQPQSAPMRGEQ